MTPTIPTPPADNEYITVNVEDVQINDYVWLRTTQRWGRVSSTWTYTNEADQERITKLVFDLTTFERYKVKIDDEPTTVIVLVGECTPDTEPRKPGVPFKSKAKPTETDESSETPAVKTTKAPAQPRSVKTGSPTTGNNVRARREALGISRVLFADLVNVTAGAQWRIEDGRPKGDELSIVERKLDELEASAKIDRSV